MERSFQIKPPTAPMGAEQLSPTGFGTKDDNNHKLKH